MFERTYNGIEYEEITEEELRDKAEGFYGEADEFIATIKDYPNRDFRLTPFSYVKFVKDKEN